MVFKCVICSQDFNQKDHLDVAKTYPKLHVVYKDCRASIRKYFTNCIRRNTPFFHNSPKQNVCPTCSVDDQYLDCIVCGETYRVKYYTQTLCPRCAKTSQRLKNQRFMIKYNKSEVGRKKSAEVGKITIQYCHEVQQKLNGMKFCEILNYVCLRCWVFNLS